MIKSTLRNIGRHLTRMPPQLGASKCLAADASRTAEQTGWNKIPTHKRTPVCCHRLRGHAIRLSGQVHLWRGRPAYFTEDDAQEALKEMGRREQLGSLLCGTFYCL